MTSSIEFEVPPRPEHLSVIRSLVAEVANMRHRLDEARIDDLRVAVSEAATNAMEAHARVSLDKAIRVRCTQHSDHLEVCIADFGSGFYPEQVKSLPDPEDPRRLDYERGLGLYLMKVLTDEIEIRSSSDGTEICLVMYLNEQISDSELQADSPVETDQNFVQASSVALDG